LYLSGDKNNHYASTVINNTVHVVFVFVDTCSAWLPISTLPRIWWLHWSRQAVKSLGFSTVWMCGQTWTWP